MHKSDPPSLASGLLGNCTLTAIGVESEVVSDSTPIPPPDYEALISQIADEILQDHSPAR